MRIKESTTSNEESIEMESPKRKKILKITVMPKNKQTNHSVDIGSKTKQIKTSKGNKNITFIRTGTGQTITLGQSHEMHSPQTQKHQTSKSLIMSPRVRRDKQQVTHNQLQDSEALRNTQKLRRKLD